MHHGHIIIVLPQHKTAKDEISMAGSRQLRFAVAFGGYGLRLKNRPVHNEGAREFEKGEWRAASKPHLTPNLQVLTGSDQTLVQSSRPSPRLSATVPDLFSLHGWDCCHVSCVMCRFAERNLHSDFSKKNESNPTIIAGMNPTTIALPEQSFPLST